LREGREDEEEVEQLGGEGEDGLPKRGRKMCDILGRFESQGGRLGDCRRWRGRARGRRSIGYELIGEDEVLEVVGRTSYGDGECSLLLELFNLTRRRRVSLRKLAEAREGGSEQGSPWPAHHPEILPPCTPRQGSRRPLSDGVHRPSPAPSPYW